MIERRENIGLQESKRFGANPHTGKKAPAIKAASVLTGSPFAVLAASPAAAQGYGDMWHGSWGWGHMAIGGLFMILFWTAIIFLGVLLVRWLAASDVAPGYRPRQPALEILEERFARGEIDHREFDEKKALLSHRRATEESR